MITFAELGLRAPTLAALSRQGITQPVAVQAEAIPPLLEGEDVVMQAPTGSGKSLAFLIPLVERLAGRPAPGPRGLVVCPTRELATQVHAVFLGLDSGLKTALLYGGTGYATQNAALKAGADVVVGTPGRVLDMIGKRLLTLSRVEYLVLDEADEMLDAGFAPDVERILGLTYEPQTVMASATMPDWVNRMIDRHLYDPQRVVLDGEHDPRLEHGLLRVGREDKLDSLVRLLRRVQGSVIVFGRTKRGVAELTRHLQRRRVDCIQLQGDMDQTARDRAMAAFRSGRAQVLVATNVAARGLDVDDVALVVSFELPDTAHSLTHRVGRTARNGAQGHAITFVTPTDELRWRRLRHEGAPALFALDVEALLERGEWLYTDQPAVQSPPPAARRRARRGRRAAATAG